MENDRNIVFALVSFLGFIFLIGCNGLETDISKKLDYDFLIFSVDSTGTSFDTVINIPVHDEIDDYVEYAVYPNPFKVNEISYMVSHVGVGNTSQTINLEGFYRNATLDIIPLFQLPNLQITPGERTVLPIGLNDLNQITNLVNDQSSFLMFLNASDANTTMIDFTVSIYFDTTVAIDYDL